MIKITIKEIRLYKFIDMEMAEDIIAIKRLANKHHRLQEMDCNGQGYIRGFFYTTGTTFNKYEKSAYIKDDLTIFQKISDEVEDKISALVKKHKGLTVEFQGDPRGYTVKLFFKGRNITELLN